MGTTCKVVSVTLGALASVATIAGVILPFVLKEKDKDKDKDRDSNSNANSLSNFNSTSPSITTAIPTALPTTSPMQDAIAGKEFFLKANGLCLQQNNEIMFKLMPCTGSSDQVFRRSSVLMDTLIIIQNTKSGRCLGVTDGITDSFGNWYLVSVPCSAYGLSAAFDETLILYRDGCLSYDLAFEPCVKGHNATRSWKLEFPSRVITTGTATATAKAKPSRSSTTTLGNVGRIANIDVARTAIQSDGNGDQDPPDTYERQLPCYAGVRDPTGRAGPRRPCK
ncbi:hypothetical protein HDU96_003494 [Phlyctochytrium bullatum]|nr:hypothetical protein HDU96_003494 [Phlyctochytrium bullatum]